MYIAPYNFRPPIDDYGNQLSAYTQTQFQSWIISTSTYGGFGTGWDDFCQNI